MRRRKKPSKPLTTRQVDRLLSRISFAATALGLAAACFVFVVLSLLLPVALYPWNEALFVALLVLLLLFAIWRLRLRRYMGQPVSAYPKAAEYFTQTVEAGRGAPVVAPLLLGAGILLSVYSALFTEYGQTATLCAISISLTVAGALFTIFRLTKQALWRKVRLFSVPDPENADVFDHHRADRRAEREAAVGGQVTDVQHRIAEKQRENRQRAHQAELQRGLPEAQNGGKGHGVPLSSFTQTRIGWIRVCVDF